MTVSRPPPVASRPCPTWQAEAHRHFARGVYPRLGLFLCFPSPHGYPPFGTRLTGLGDLDGDGTMDFAAAGEMVSMSSTPVSDIVVHGGGYVVCLQGFSRAMTSLCPFDIAGVPDMDGDGGMEPALMDVANGVAAKVLSALTRTLVSSIPSAASPSPPSSKGSRI